MYYHLDPFYFTNHYVYTYGHTLPVLGIIMYKYIKWIVRCILTFILYIKLGLCKNMLKIVPWSSRLLSYRVAIDFQIFPGFCFVLLF
jgi:hypothetical protein